jgi:hypothetical protein
MEVPSETVSLLERLSGGIPVALLALIILVVVWRFHLAKSGEWDAERVALLADHEVERRAWEAERTALHRQLLEQASTYGSEALKMQATLSDRVIETTRDQAPLMKQAVDVLGRVALMLENETRAGRR